MKNIKVSVLIILFACMLVMGAIFAYADVGNFNDYDSGGSSFDSFDSFDSDSYSGSYSGDGDFTLEDIVFFAPVAVIIIIVALVFGAKSGSVPSGTVTRAHISDNTQAVSEQIRAEDSNFSADKFISWSKEVFIQLQDAWTKRDWKLVRPLENDTLFKTHQMQLQDHINHKRTNIIENICVNEAFLTAYSKDLEYAYLTVYIKVKMNDYFIDDETKKVLRGDPNQLYHMQYLLKFMRSLDTKTEAASSGLNTTNCPNCGAPTDITSTGQCKYCEGVITTGKFGWVLCEITSPGK